ncbi:recombination mediator RecR [Porphyromonas levii]|uniref:recombination mediator RecR n=1 Tax=Porphyromonas levii TaxID=28114 RepID=UPI001B8D19B4|nr:recombination mediator RecR [Porphyromonas levii]MBR8713020.1 Recombination protein RecR [Porphyromonas levii]MBR8715067.1 Recombination protein RecR [Porphyromonas levii]MBR8727569.1 Recombination protein RecR [Porphyromonas levii]MBR8735928.1 Recombination protein RecR [Porphyromonas levii]MBR8777959.1 Recombination protein RecR [Porphyromonas levii]
MQQTDDYSFLLQRAIDAFSSLPGVGRKSALRLALFLLKQDKGFTHRIVDSLRDFVDGIQYCERCHNISDEVVCKICSDTGRDASTLCVVESVRDVMAIENTGQYTGLYHVLGGIISPMDGVGPADLFLQDLPKRVVDEGIKEVILALSTTMEGDTTNFYIYRMLKDLPVKISAIARGVAIGDELEYADDLTLGRSILQRIDFSDTLRR